MRDCGLCTLVRHAVLVQDAKIQYSKLVHVYFVHTWVTSQALVDELEERLNICHSKGVEDEEAVNKATKASRALREKGNHRRSPKKRSPRGSPGRAAAGIRTT